MNKNDRICKNCGHDINWHRFLKSAKPGVCLFLIVDKDGREHNCPCNKFVPGD